MTEVIHIPTEALLDVNRTMLIREWWYTYLLLLKGNKLDAKLRELTDECEKRGIVKIGQMMPHDGADDFFREVEELKRKEPKP